MIIKGDLNGDGKIDEQDLRLLENHIYERAMLTGNALIAADVNNDGLIDLADIPVLTLHLMGRKMINEVIK